MKKDIYREFINLLFDGVDESYQQELLDKLETVDETELR